MTRQTGLLNQAGSGVVVNQECGTVEFAPATTGVVAATLPRQAARGARLSGLSGLPALVLLASLIVSLLAASGAPTPLYAIYQQRWGFSPVTTTIVFGVYALAVLASLLTFG